MKRWRGADEYDKAWGYWTWRDGKRVWIAGMTEEPQPVEVYELGEITKDGEVVVYRRGRKLC